MVTHGTATPTFVILCTILCLLMGTVLVTVAFKLVRTQLLTGFVTML